MNSPYLAYGVQCENKAMLKRANDQFVKVSTCVFINGTCMYGMVIVDFSEVKSTAFVCFGTVLRYLFTQSSMCIKCFVVIS